MREAFAKTLTELAGEDARIVLLTGDLGYMALEPFLAKFPERFINVGVAEQNMVGIATGLAEAGFLPFVYSIVTFSTLRPYEFIRNGPVLHKLPVRIVGIGGGVEYGHNGATHYGLEDLAVMRAQPGLTVVAPADAAQTETALRKTFDMPGPLYYRLGKNGGPQLSELSGDFELGRLNKLKEGGQLAIVTTGAIADEAVLAADMLKQEGIDTAVYLVSSFNPAPIADIQKVIQSYSVVISLEAHYQVGGLSSCIAEVIAASGARCRLVPCAITEQPEGITGSKKFLYKKFGIDAGTVCRRAAQLVSAKCR